MSNTNGNLIMIVVPKDDLTLLFDEDDNGTNGDEYLLEEAKAEGFKNNAEYFIDKYTLHTGEVFYTSLLDQAFRSSCYGDYKYIEFEHTLIVGYIV